jgi:signal peptidase I
MLSKTTLQNLLNKTGSMTLRVNGQSMMPTLAPGDCVQIKPFNFESLSSGDIIAFYQHDECLVHRVKCRVGLGVLTCGDNNILLDKLVTRDFYLGRVSTQIKQSGIRSEFLPTVHSDCAPNQTLIKLFLENRSFTRVADAKPKHLTIGLLTPSAWQSPNRKIIGLSPYGLSSEETSAHWLSEDNSLSLIQTSFGSQGSGLVPVTKVRGVVRLGIYDYWPWQVCSRTLVSYLDGFIGGVVA